MENINDEFLQKITSLREEFGKENTKIEKNIYNTGWQIIFVAYDMALSQIATNLNINDDNIKFITRWNNILKKWEVYKPGTSHNQNIKANRGDAIMIKVHSNDKVTIQCLSSYNWILKIGWNLIGLETEKTLSQIATSIGNNVNLITYIEPQTGKIYRHVPGNDNNASILVRPGEGFWVWSNNCLDKPRIW